MTRLHDRREFLQMMAATTAAALAAGYSATAKGYAANETISVACIGTGGRCRKLMEPLNKIDGVRITAVCDVWDVHREMGRQLADPKAIVSKNFRELLERKDIDAVLIGAPDHWHVPMTIAACQAGKDVYVEKPLTHDAREGRAVIEAVNKSGRIVQVGNQQRSMPHFQKAVEIVNGGSLGEIHKVHLTWNRNQPRHKLNKLEISPQSVDWQQFVGNAREQPFDPYRFRNWRWFWDFGGGILTDLMVHFIDVAHWYLKLDHPDSGVTIGDNYQTAGLWETPDTIQTLLEYPQQQVEIYFEGTFMNARNGAMLEFMGKNATLYLDRGRYEVIPERNSKAPASELILGSGPRGADFYDQPDGELLHLSNWIQCVRSRQTPNSPVEAGVAAVTGAHLGNRAFRSEKRARWEELSGKIE